MLFRRVLGTDPKAGAIPTEMVQKVSEREAYIAEVEQLRQRMLLEQARQQERFAMDLF